MAESKDMFVVLNEAREYATAVYNEDAARALAHDGCTYVPATLTWEKPRPEPKFQVGDVLLAFSGRCVVTNGPTPRTWAGAGALPGVVDRWHQERPARLRLWWRVAEGGCVMSDRLWIEDDAYGDATLWQGDGEYPALIVRKGNVHPVGGRLIVDAVERQGQGTIRIDGKDVPMNETVIWESEQHIVDHEGDECDGCELCEPESTEVDAKPDNVEESDRVDVWEWLYPNGGHAGIFAHPPSSNSYATRKGYAVFPGHAPATPDPEEVIQEVLYQTGGYTVADVLAALREHFDITPKGVGE